MNWTKNSITSALSMVLMAILIGGSGFYFGFKTGSKPLNSLSQSKDSKPYPENLDKTLIETEKPTEKIISKEVPGVQWIKANQAPTCDKDYPVKGKFNKTNQYYTKSAKTYGRKVPDIYFATEEFARDNAGFIKKF